MRRLSGIFVAAAIERIRCCGGEVACRHCGHAMTDSHRDQLPIARQFCPACGCPDALPLNPTERHGPITTRQPRLYADVFVTLNGVPLKEGLP